MASIESAVIRVVATVTNQLSPGLHRLVPPPPPDVDPVLLAYLESPDFAEVARQVVLYRAMRGELDPNLSADLREQIVQGLRLAGASADPKAVLNALTSADPLRPGDLGTQTAVAVAHLGNASKNNTLILRRAKSVEDFHEYARQLRARIATMHSEMRLPHIGISRSVPYDELYVQPTLSSGLVVDELSLPGRRTVLKGSPGAGKSTLAAKLVHDVALSDGGRVPFLLVLRDFSSSFREGGRELLRYLEHICSDPYNLAPPRDGVEYLLRNGRAVVVLDGLDELVEPELRRRVVRLIEGFAHQYPLTPIVVTARQIGYTEAPLSESLFSDGDINKFGPDQVADYATRWFALDSSSPAHKRAGLANAFLKESADASDDLRDNPLLLALLCAMYSSEHYIPRNLAQVYERCAVLLFDRWDSMRGIDLPVQFQGRLRAAVQHLAWHQFTAPESGRALPRSRIVRVLADYLESKSFDADDALGAAEDFADFCTGRAWILTDIGATRAEPLFGFTHRTFLEYFAAEHLVRSSRSADDLWRTLRARVEDGAWNVINQIALQLHDRNVDDGADEVLKLAMREGQVRFAARALRYATPQPATVRAIVHASVDAVMDVEFEQRASFNEGGLLDGDMALESCLSGALPANSPIVHRALLDRLSGSGAADDEEAGLLIQGLLGLPDLDPGLQSAVHELHRSRSGGRQRQWPWQSRMDYLPSLATMVAERGPRSLFERYSFLGVTNPAPVAALLSFSNTIPFDRVAADRLATVISRHRNPWMSGDRWLRDYDMVSAKELVPQGKLHSDLVALLSLPYLEMHVDRDRAVPFQLMTLHEELIEGRGGGYIDVADVAHLPGVKILLHEWTEGRFDVFSWR